MRIGIDFDNTIVSYDHLFHRIALEKNVIPKTIPINKNAIRNFLRAVNEEATWTYMQGEVYGSRMAEAVPYAGVLNFMIKAQSNGHQLFIVSHKTKYPFIGPAYNLHDTARNWIVNSLLTNGILLDFDSEIFFEATKEEKISRIAALECDIFIDDLPEILNMPGFLIKTDRILFDPEFQYLSTHPHLKQANSWNYIEKLLLDAKQ